MTSTIALIEPVAWMHTLHMELDQNSVIVSVSDQHPFGEADKDYDPSYTITSVALVPATDLDEVLTENARLFKRYLDYGESLFIEEERANAAATRLLERAELAERQRDEAMKALEPFAKMAVAYDNVEDKDPVLVTYGENPLRITVGDLRAARNAMGGTDDQT